MENTKLEFRDNALKAVAQKAINLKTGARGLSSIIENVQFYQEATWEMAWEAGTAQN